MTKQYVLSEDEYEELISKLKSIYGVINNDVKETGSANSWCARDLIQELLYSLDRLWDVK